MNQDSRDLAIACPYVDEIIALNMSRYRKDFLYRVATIRRLRSRRFDLAIHPVFSPTQEGDEILYCSWEKRSIGFEGDACNIDHSLQVRNRRFYSKRIQIESGVTQEGERNRFFTERLCGVHIPEKTFLPELWMSDADRLEGMQILSAQGLDSSGSPLVAVFPGALGLWRTWPIGNFARLADLLVEQYDAKVLLCGSISERSLARSVAAQMKSVPTIVAGKTSLRQLGAIFERCSLFVGNDTGPLHLAVATGTPTLGLMGGGHFGRFYPYGNLDRHRMVYKKMDCYHCNWKCIHETVRCIQELYCGQCMARNATNDGRSSVTGARATRELRS